MFLSAIHQDLLPRYVKFSFILPFSDIVFRPESSVVGTFFKDSFNVYVGFACMYVIEPRVCLWSQKRLPGQLKQLGTEFESFARLVHWYYPVRDLCSSTPAFLGVRSTLTRLMGSDLKNFLLVLCEFHI